MSPLSPAMLLFGADPGMDDDEALATNIRAVLETQPGRVPWAPTFGCDLERYLGVPLSSSVLTEVHWRVTEALRRWVPGVALTRLDVEAVQLDDGQVAVWRGVPLAESALMGLGTQAALSIRIEVQTPRGVRSLRTVLSP